MSNIGDSLFTPEELEAERVREEQSRKEYEAKLANGFFRDGHTRRIVFTGIEKEDKVSQKGNNYVLHTYHVEDPTTGERETLVDRNFAFTNAMSPIKKELGVNLRIGTTVLSCTTMKSGEREYNGVMYPEYTYELSVASNPGTSAGDTDIRTALGLDTDPLK